MKNIFTYLLMISSLFVSHTLLANNLDASGIVVESEVVNASCMNANGSILLTISGGVAPYAIVWQGIPAGNGTSFTNLASGAYVFEITDAVGCVQSELILVGNDDLVAEIICGSDANSLTASVVSGTAPYTFLWNNGATVQEVSGLTTGTYSVTVTDANGCEAVAVYEFEEGPYNPCDLTNNFLQVVMGPCNDPTLDRYLLSLNGQSLTNNDCLYYLDSANIELGNNEVTIENTGDLGNLLNGITTLDLVYIFRGLVFGFDTNFEIVAADFDGDMAISTKDLVEMRRYVLGLEAAEKYQQYKIVDINHSFGADFAPFNLGSDFTSFAFTDADLGNGALPVRIIKGGDINGTAQFTSEGTPTVRELALVSFQDIEMKAGQVYQVDFDLNAASDFQAASFEILGTDVNMISVDEKGNDLLYNNKISSLALSYFTETPKNSTSFSVEIEAISDGQLSDMISLNNDFLREVVGADLSVGELNLSANVVSSSLELTENLFTIYPNPANDFLNITFENNSSSAVKYIELLSIDGKSFSSYETSAEKFAVDLEAIQTTGLHLIRITQDGKTNIEKVLIY